MRSTNILFDFNIFSKIKNQLIVDVTTTTKYSRYDKNLCRDVISRNECTNSRHERKIFCKNILYITILFILEIKLTLLYRKRENLLIFFFKVKLRAK